MFLRRRNEPYDIIIVDAFTGSYIPFHLMTKEFYGLVRDRLAPHGVAAFNILPGTKLYDSNVRTLKTVFDRIDLYHTRDEAAGGDSVLVMAPLVMWMGVSREDLVKPERKGLSADKILP